MENKTIIKKMNKKGASFSGWSEAIVIGVLFIIAFGLIVTSFNDKYHQNQDSSFGMGLQDSATTTYNSMTEYQEQIQNATNTGTASFASVFGLTLSTSYDLLKTSMGLFWTFISGGWILKAVTLMKLPAILGTIFQLLFLLSIGYILLKILFRIKV